MSAQFNFNNGIILTKNSIKKQRNSNNNGVLPCLERDIKNPFRDFVLIKELSKSVSGLLKSPLPTNEPVESPHFSSFHVKMHNIMGGVASIA